MNDEQTITLTNSERGWAGELCAKLLLDNETSLRMLEKAVKTGESKPNNPNIAEHKRVLDYLEPLFNKLENGEGEIELSAIEAGELDKLINDAQTTLEYTELDFMDELQEACEQDLEDEELSDEAQAFKEPENIFDILSPLAKRLGEGKFPWPKRRQD
jgi:hypothetical protein